jgi:uncharacterized protein (DUF362 family)
MNTNFFSPKVSVVRNEKIDGYPDDAPFNPSSQYAEYPWGKGPISEKPNRVYEMVRESFYLLGMDHENYGKKTWNPLSEIVKPSDKVVIKPNAVLHYNADKTQSVFASITHSSVLRPIIDFVIIALQGKGQIIIADCPMMNSNFKTWKSIMQLEKILDFYKGKTQVALSVLDLRETTTKWIIGFTPALYRKKVNLDPLGYTVVDLGEKSQLQSFNQSQIENAYGADYRVNETIEYHSNNRHAYKVSNTILDSDVLISVPKLKVHKKVGVTLNIKGMVGIIGDKNSIIHSRRGSLSTGGDEYPPDLSFLQKKFNEAKMFLITKVLAKYNIFYDLIYLLLEIPRRLAEKILIKGSETNRKYLGGSWSGNDSAWRMGPDLLNIAIYGRINQNVVGNIPRRFFSVIDGILGGEDDGPLSPTVKNSGVIISGFNPVAVDWVSAQLMNFDPEKLKILNNSKSQKGLTWQGEKNPVINSNEKQIIDLWDNNFNLDFLPPLGWRGQVERIKK